MEMGEQLMLWIEQYWWLIILISIWSLIWKGLALWRATKRQELIWFVVLLVINSVGILEIIYLLTTRQKDRKSSLE